MLPSDVFTLGDYDCYNTKCKGDLDHNNTHIICDNYENYCDINKTTGNHFTGLSDFKLKLSHLIKLLLCTRNHIKIEIVSVKIKT